MHQECEVITTPLEPPLRAEIVIKAHQAPRTLVVCFQAVVVAIHPQAAVLKPLVPELRRVVQVIMDRVIVLKTQLSRRITVAVDTKMLDIIYLVHCKCLRGKDP
jgi:hypothetical protein